MKNKTLAQVCGVVGIVWGTMAILAPVLIVILRRPRQPQHYEAVIILGIINLLVIALGVKALRYYRGDVQIKRWVPKLFLTSGDSSYYFISHESSWSGKLWRRSFLAGSGRAIFTRLVIYCYPG